MDEFVWVTLSDEYGDAGVYCGIWICENISFDEDSIIQNASELSRLDDQPQKHGYQGKYYPPPCMLMRIIFKFNWIPVFDELRKHNAYLY